MFIITWLRWIRGTVVFIINGAFPERLVNMCARHGIAVWGIAPRQSGYEAGTYASNYRKLRPLAKQTKTRIKIKSRSGLPFVVHRHRKRYGILIGAVLAVVLFVSLSMRIWNIEVNGCQTITADEIIIELDELGLKTGVLKSEIDAREIERRMMLKDSRIAWIAINLIGNSVEIEIRETVMPPDRLDLKNKAANVIAGFDGQITYMEIYNGQAVLRIGDTVMAGEMIISGVMEDQHKNTKITYARAMVLAKTQEERSVEINLREELWTADGSPEVSKYIEIAGFKIPFSLPKKMKAERYETTHEITQLLGKPIINYIAVTNVPMRKQIITRTEFEAKEIAMRMLLQAEQDDDPSRKVISRDITGYCENGVYRLTEKLSVIKNIAVQSEFLSTQATING